MPMQHGWAAAGLLMAQIAGSAWAQPSPPPQSPPIVVGPGVPASDIWRHAIRSARLKARLGATARRAAVPGSGAPEITAGSVSAATVNVATPSAGPVITFKFDSPSAFEYGIFEFTSPHGQVLNVDYEPMPYTESGTVTFHDYDSILRLYAEPGAWTLTSAEIASDTGETTYDAAQLAKLFTNNTMNVVNDGTPDFTPPTVSGGKLLTRIIHLSSPNPEFKATLTGTDSGSGVAEAVVLIQFPNAGPVYPAGAILPLPLASGTAAADLSFKNITETGTYEIVGFGAVDVAGNAFLDQSATDIKALFGTTQFKVSP